MIHQFVTIEKLRARATQALPSIRPPLNYVVEVLSLATLKILDQTYKTFKGTAIRKKHKHRGGRIKGGTGAAASTHFGADLRGRFSVFRSASPLRGATAAAGSDQQQGASSSPRRGQSPREQQRQQQQQQPSSPKQPRPPSLALPILGSPAAAAATAAAATPASTEAITPASSGGDRTGGGAAALLTNGVDFGVSHAAMYPFVTAGASFLIDVCDVITCQLFYNSDLIRFVDLLLALDHAPPPLSSNPGSGHGSVATPTVSASGATTIKVQHWSELRDKSGPPKGGNSNNNERVASGRLGRIPVPLPCVGRTFGHLFATLMAEHEAMPLALYRHDAKADVYYVFTGPPPPTVLRPSDFVFLLAPVESLRRMLAQYGGS